MPQRIDPVTQPTDDADSAVDTMPQSPRSRRILTRRNFIRATGGVLAVGGGLFGYATCVEPFWLAVAAADLTVPNLPESWVGKRLIHASDLHLGSTDRNYLESVIQTINSLHADLLVLTGDFLDHEYPDGVTELDSLMATLRPGTRGAVACLGNHDYGRNWRNSKLADRVVQVMNDRGIQTLRNESVVIDGLNLIGLGDYWTPDFGPGSVLDSAKSDQASLCLCHNPDVCDVDVWGDFHGVVMSGHTHGGQCKPPFAPPPRLPVRNRRYVAGLYRLDAQRQLFISKGVGYTRQARFNCRPEINVLTLRGETPTAIR